SIRRNREKPAVSLGHRSRSSDEASVRGLHQGQQSLRTAPTGRTHDCKRLLCGTLHFLLPGGGHPHMKRRAFITLLGGAAAPWPLAARGRQRDQGRRIGVLAPAAANDPVWQARLGAFQQALALLGWIIGRNVRIDTRWATTDAAAIRREAEELAALAPDVLLAA